MIFNTTTDINGKTGNHINNGIKNLFNGKFFSPQDFSLSEVLSKSDLEAIKNYNEEFDRLKNITSKYPTQIKDSTIAQKAYNNTLINSSDTVKTLQKNTNGGKIATDGLTKSSKAAELGMKGLAMAGNAVE